MSLKKLFSYKNNSTRNTETFTLPQKKKGCYAITSRYSPAINQDVIKANYFSDTDSNAELLFLASFLVQSPVTPRLIIHSVWKLWRKLLFSFFAKSPCHRRPRIQIYYSFLFSSTLCGMFVSQKLQLIISTPSQSGYERHTSFAIQSEPRTAPVIDSKVILTDDVRCARE